MIIATDLRPGTVIHFEGDLHKIVDAVYHAGGGKLTGTVHAKLQSVRTGSIIGGDFGRMTGSTESSWNGPDGSTSMRTAMHSTS